MSRKSVALTTAVLLVIGLLGIGAYLGYDYVMTRLVRERCYVALGDGETLTLTAEQSRNAAIIVAASFKADLPEQAAVIALATAYQESGLRNLDYGDRDSLGLFQQRPSYGWGTEEQLMDPWYSSGRFYEELVKFDNWEQRDITEMAQQVQRSGHPDAYRKHEANAMAVAGALRGTRPATLVCVDRTENPGDPGVFEELVAQVPGVSTEVQGDVVRFTSQDEAALWAATHLALANTRDAGIVSAELPTHRWEQGNEQAWTEGSPDGQPGVAELRLRQ
ncbi:hypothetical protein LKO27_08825 [Tessaracoccus sp. OS52]|uniref:hypothetical protein n=1 Tax=Tessaracoccus sp. OS52 TaxID=2886691 RepID=UPI001D11FEB2|nr:hypothetical protein [Tessaracoccus sp. OS52]MCC2593510.1 hypothetical protein [Tessaracoccus sp. OS52]